MNHPDIDKTEMAERLNDERARLLDQSEMSQESRETVQLDQQSVGRLSRMDALQGQAMAKAEEVRRKLQVRRIDSALIRLERGEYGQCVDCGEWISLKRLQWDPAVLKCIDCAS